MLSERITGGFESDREDVVEVCGRSRFEEEDARLLYASFWWRFSIIHRHCPLLERSPARMENKSEPKRQDQPKYKGRGRGKHRYQEDDSQHAVVNRGHLFLEHGKRQRRRYGTEKDEPPAESKIYSSLYPVGSMKRRNEKTNSVLDFAVPLEEHGEKISKLVQVSDLMLGRLDGRIGIFRLELVHGRPAQIMCLVAIRERIICAVQPTRSFWHLRNEENSRAGCSPTK